jgi:aspartyl-tRNA(Asn)/glutamyl-tRNA(Gln) amidotransferase subunit C
MSLTLEQVEHIANLARLELSKAEKILYQVQLSAILEAVARLQELDTTGIPPTASILPQRNELRRDEIQAGLAVEQLLRNAPESDQDQFRVPPVFE